MKYSQAQLTAMARHVLAKLDMNDGDPSADYLIVIMTQLTGLTHGAVMVKIEALARGETVT